MIFTMKNVLVLALFVMHFFGTKVSVVGNSMSEELVNNDQVLINTLIYRLREPKQIVGEAIPFCRRPGGGPPSDGGCCAADDIGQRIKIAPDRLARSFCYPRGL